MSKRGRILFYSSVADIDLFNITAFYVLDIKILESLGFKVIVTNRYKDFFSFKSYDVAFIYFWSKGLIPGVIARIFGKKVYYTGGIDYIDRNYNKPTISYTIRSVFFLCCRFISNKCFVVSKSDIDNIKKITNHLNKIVYAPHAIPILEYHQNSSKEKVCTTICWMESVENVKRKGVDRGLFLFKKLHDVDPSYKFYIIGTEGEGSTYLRRFVDDLRLTDAVTFTGRLSNQHKIDLLNQSSFYFQPSIYEGFGLAALEAMACGAVVVHTGVGGLADVVADYGLLLGDDEASIIKKLVDLNPCSNELNEMSARSKKYVADKFDIDVRKSIFNEFIEV